MSEWNGNELVSAEHMRRQRDQARDELSRLKVQCFEEIIPELRSQVADLREALKRARTFHPHESSVTRQIDAALEMSGGVK